MQSFADVKLSLYSTAAGGLIKSNNSVLRTVELIKLFTNEYSGLLTSLPDVKLAQHYTELINKPRKQYFIDLVSSGANHWSLYHIYGEAQLTKYSDNLFSLSAPTWVAGYLLKDKLTNQDYVLTRSGSYYAGSDAYNKLLRSRLILL